MTIKRRHFLKSSLAAGAAISLPAMAYGRVLGTNEKIRCAVIGLNGRGKDHIRGLGDNVVAYCDCDESILGQRADGKDVATFVDYRKLLEQKDIDAVSIATPNHQHSIMGIRAVMAGKHVYCEKPVSHNVWEGRQLTEAQKKYDRIIQCGTQSRSSPSLQEASAWVRGGALGKIQYAIGTCFKPRKSIGKLDSPLKLAKSVNYDMWCGPAEKRELYRPKLHYDWHWDFNTGNGDMGNQGIHQMDIARWFLGYDTISPRVLSIGGRLGYEDAADTPNTQTVIHDYPDAPLIFETRGLPKAKEFQAKVESKSPKYWDRNMDNYRGSKIGVIVQCENGYVVIPSYGSAKAFDNDGNEVQSWSSSGDHYANFLDAVASNDQSKLNAPIVEGHISSALCHTGGMSHQLGEQVALSDIESSLDSESDIFKESFDRLKQHLIANGVDVESGKALTLGADIKFDENSEQVLGNEKASHMMSRDYRAGYEVPSIAAKAAS
ncbi:Gfo/Idh/MocA family oxidoreductase [Mariniblastus fucicola]|uniref:Inositol 2-dehydrogenase n=1 Tax=Mariniblastus fucicola TaxID=980251 RepID=A0A5B9PG33_9BACT|nr:Gfo/Idh/MocA family oxidoreductase [Mariniblastus fucicola]QEG24190.1 Inositol 2-dehydrogenase [Mariniblastus fucicola]